MPAAASIESDSHAAVDKVFYPLTFPLTVGTGTIVVVLTLSANASGRGWSDILLAHVSIFVASALLALLVFLSYGYAPALARKVPEHAFNGVQRLISFILLCIGVDRLGRTGYAAAVAVALMVRAPSKSETAHRAPFRFSPEPNLY